jgi:fatty-acyl-CoA synthase
VSEDLATWIDDNARRNPTSLALEFEGRCVSQQTFAESVADAASWLHERGVGPGDRVAYLGPNRPEAIELLFACSRLAAVYLPLNSRLAPAEHRWILDDAEPSLIVEDSQFCAHLDVVNHSAQRAALPEAWSGWGNGNSAETPRVGTNSDAVLLAYTSGTTGHPKGAVLNQAALRANASNGIAAHDLTAVDRVLTLLPLFHVGGLNIQTMPAMSVGAPVLLHRAFDPTAWIEDVERWQPTLSLLVPATLVAVSQHPGFAAADLSSLRGLMTGSSTVPDAVLRPYLNRGIAVGQIYGSTETAPTAIALRLEDSFEHPLSCGTPAALCEVRVVDSDSNDVEPGARGELWVKGPNILTEYWRNPVATAESITDGWFHTGDVGHVDPDGFFYIDDRIKDVIISGGENVYPAEIENVLADCREVADGVVIARPDERWGEVPIVVAVAASPTINAALTDAVLDHFAGRLARFKIPKDVVWVDELPRNAMGKVLKHVLRDNYRCNSS